MACLMWRGYAVLLVALALSACSGGDPGSDPPASERPPNILFIVLDDLGFNDLGINTGHIGQTPALNQFAREGVRFTRNYVDSTCSATRAGILSGTSPASRGFRPSGLGLSPEITTLPEALQDAGYSTHHVGKWHLGYASQLAWPHNQGYDSFYGFLSQFLLRGPHRDGHLKIGVPTYRNPWLQREDGPPTKHQGHLTDLLLAEVLQFLRSAREREQPWFLNYWTYLPHTPLQPGKAFADQFPDTPEGRYQAMLAQLDDAVGQVLQALEETGLSDNTLVVIASDNGGTGREANSNAPFAGVKMTFQEGGVRTPLMVRWPDGRGSGGVVDETVSYLDYFPTLAAAAGAQVPTNLPGRDIAALMTGGRIEATPLLWDAGDSESHAWSILSADGRWRLHRFYTWPPVLNDLLADPSGTADTGEQNPERLSLMHREFLIWRDQQRVVHYNYELAGDSGSGRLTGESLQRAPGFGGYTFAVAMVPEGYGAEETQVIAVQKGQWQVTLVGGELLLDINGIVLRAPAPPEGRCTPLVVAAEHSWNPFHPDRSEARLDLYLDSKLAAKTVAPLSQYHPDTYAEPTWLGQDSEGKQRFKGTLGRPVILNERIRMDEESDPWVGNGLSRVSSGLCAELDSKRLALGQR